MVQPNLNDLEKYAERCSKDPVFFIKHFLGWTLSPAQEELVTSIPKHRFIAAAFARQTGKSTAVAAYIVWRLLFGPGYVVNGLHHDEDILVAAPGEEQAKIIFQNVKQHISKNELLRSFVDGDMTISKMQMKNGAKLSIVSASVNAQIRGRSPSCLIVDESQSVDDYVFNSVLLPMTTTTRAPVVCIGTPLTKNYFYKLVQNPETHVIMQPYNKCPFIDAIEIEKKRSDRGGTMSIQAWRQEYNVEFIEEIASPLPRDLVYPCLIEYSFTRDEEVLVPAEKSGDYSIGVDLGREHDAAVIQVIQKNMVPYRLVHTESWLHRPYTHVAGRLNLLSQHFNPSAINVDQTNEKGFQDLLNEVGVAINPISFTQKDKQIMIDNLRVLFEKKLLEIPKGHDLLYMQIINQQQEVSKYGKKLFYHPQSEHDDELWALALAAMAVNVDVSGYNPISGFSAPIDSTSANIVIAPRLIGGGSIKEKDAAILKQMRQDNINMRANGEGTESVSAKGGWYGGLEYRPKHNRARFGGM